MFVDIASTTATEKEFRYSQEVVEHFWRRWLRKYIPALTCRRKWHGESEPVAVGDILIVANDFNPRGQWPLARVIEVLPSSDGIVRVVRVKMSITMRTLTVTRLCRLLSTNPIKPEQTSKTLKLDNNLENKTVEKRKH